MCDQGHVSTRWWSQPRFPYGVPAGDVMMSSSLLFSGNNYEKIELFLKFLNIKCVEPTLFRGIQRNLLVPAIEEMWDTTLNNIIQKYKKPDIALVVIGKLFLLALTRIISI